jgi:hypothetical protein
MATAERARDRGRRRRRLSGVRTVRGEGGSSAGARMREGESEWGCKELEMAEGGVVAASACDVGAESTACARVVCADSLGGRG